MKKSLFCLLLTVIFCLSTHAQETSNNELRNLRNEIAQTYSELEKEEEKFEKMDVSAAGFEQISAQREKINNLKTKIATLTLKERQMAESDYLKTLPDNQIELLKILIMQNRQIIKLLSEKQ